MSKRYGRSESEMSREEMASPFLPTLCTCSFHPFFFFTLEPIHLFNYMQFRIDSMEKLYVSEQLIVSFRCS